MGLSFSFEGCGLELGEGLKKGEDSRLSDRCQMLRPISAPAVDFCSNSRSLASRRDFTRGFAWSHLYRRMPRVPISTKTPRRLLLPSSNMPLPEKPRISSSPAIVSSLPEGVASSRVPSMVRVSPSPFSESSLKASLLFPAVPYTAPGTVAPRSAAIAGGGLALPNSPRRLRRTASRDEKRRRCFSDCGLHPSR